jgi:cold shock CspA family protein
MDILQKTFVQLPSVVFLYKQFFARKQDPEESISSFANDLESLRLDIEQYHSTVFEDILIRDHFIYNLHDVNLKLELVRYIRENSSSTFEDVYNEARTTIALLKHIMPEASPPPVFIRQQAVQSANTSSPVSFSNQTAQPATKARRTILICDWCNKHGHVEKFCYSKERYFKLKKIKTCFQSTCDYKPGSTVRGRIKWFNPSSGYGFICLGDSDKDIFFHRSDLHKHNRHNFAKFAATGQTVTFSLSKTEQGFRASNVCVENNMPIPCSPDKRSLSTDCISTETDVKTVSRAGQSDVVDLGVVSCFLFRCVRKAFRTLGLVLRFRFVDVD